MTKFDKGYWESRYQHKKIGWDLGEVSPPIKSYFNQLDDKSLKILIPGAGNSYEAEYLWNNNFNNTYIVDIAKQPLEEFKSRNPTFPDHQIINENFFEINGQFDLIIEQTFFCALEPTLRDNYVKKMFELLKPNGKLVGLFFNFPLTNEGPPFGGNAEMYRNLFESEFNIKTLEKSSNSIKPRQGKELFFIFEKK